MKNIIFALMLSIFLIGCNSDDEPKTRTVINETVNENDNEEIAVVGNEYPQQNNNSESDAIQVEVEKETITEIVTIEIIKEVPIIIEPEPEPEIIPGPEEKTMIAVLFYDGSLKYLNDDYTLSVIQDAANVAKAGDYFLIDNELKKLTLKTSIPINPASKAVFYGGNLFYYGIDKKLYMMNLTDKVNIMIYNNTSNYDIALTENGIVAGFTFFFPDGSFDTGQYWGHDTVIKLDKIGSNYDKYAMTAGIWLKVGSGYYSNFVKGAALVTNDKIIFSKGATLENDTLSEPVFNTSTMLFQGGNAFQEFIQPNNIKPIFHTIGAIGDTGYFLNARDGKIYKYDIVNDVLTPWIEITAGTGNDDSVDSKELFDIVNPVIVGNEIIFFNGTDTGLTAIYRVDVSTGIKTYMADATNFKGWSL